MDAPTRPPAARAARPGPGSPLARALAAPAAAGVALGALAGPSAIGVTGATVAIPDAAAALGATPVALGWPITVYIVCLALANAIAARLIAVRGARELLVAGAVLLTAGAAATLLAPSLAAVTVARGLAGAGAGVLAALAFALAAAAPPRERARVLGTLAGVMAASIGLGPLLGGLLAPWSWRAALALPLLALLAVPAVARRAAGVPREPGAKLDRTGAALLVAAAGGLILALQAPATDAAAPVVALLAAVALAGTAASVRHVARRPDGFLPRAIAGRRELAPWWVLAVGAQAGQVAALVLVPQLIGARLGWSPVAIGAVLALLSLLGVAASRAAAAGAEGPAGVGVAAATGALLAAALAVIGLADAAPWAVLVAGGFGFAALGSAQVVLMHHVAGAVPGALVAPATGIASLALLVGGAAGSAVTSLGARAGDVADAGPLAALLPLAGALAAFHIGRGLASRPTASRAAAPGAMPLTQRQKEQDVSSTSTTKVAVVYYSSTGSVHRLAQAVVSGAESAGAEVRLLRVPELAPPEAIAANPAWEAHLAATADVPEVELDDLLWADAVVLGSPTRFGLPAAQLKELIDRTGPLWAKNRLAGKVYASFTSTSTLHGGHESTLLAINNAVYHWGGVIVPPGYTDPVQFVTGNPYGASHTAPNGTPPGGDELRSAEHLGRRVAEVATRLRPWARRGDGPAGDAAPTGEAFWFLGGRVEVLLGSDRSAGDYSVLRHVLPPGSATPLHAQPADDENFVVVRGELELWVDGESRIHAAGDAIHVPRGTPHALRAGSEGVELVAFGAPAGHERFFGLAGDRVAEHREPPEGPPDVERLEAAAEAAGVALLGPPPFER